MPLAYIRDTLTGSGAIYGTAPDASEAVVWAEDPLSGAGNFERLAEGLRVVTDSAFKPVIAEVASPETEGFTVKVTAVRRGGAIEFGVDSFVAIASPGRDWKAQVRFYFGNTSTIVNAGFYGDGSGDLLFDTGAAVPEGATDFEFIFDAVGNSGTLKRNGATVKTDELGFGGFFPGEGANTEPPIGPIPEGVLTTRITGYNTGGESTCGTVRTYSLETEGEVGPPPNADFWTAFRGAREVG